MFKQRQSALQVLATQIVFATRVLSCVLTVLSSTHVSCLCKWIGIARHGHVVRLSRLKCADRLVRCLVHRTWSIWGSGRSTRSTSEKLRQTSHLSVPLWSVGHMSMLDTITHAQITFPDMPRLNCGGHIACIGHVDLSTRLSLMSSTSCADRLCSSSCICELSCLLPMIRLKLETLHEYHVRKSCSHYGQWATWACAGPSCCPFVKIACFGPVVPGITQWSSKFGFEPESQW